MKRLLSAPSEEWRSEGDLLLRHALGVARHLGARVELLAHPFGQAEGTVPRSGLDLHGASRAREGSYTTQEVKTGLVT